jgi:hypothetical protein
MNYFRRLELTIDVPEFDISACRLVQIADVPNRDRFKYTLWEKESAPPTPLHVYAVPESYAKSLLLQLPRAVLDREVPGVFYMKMEKPHPNSTVPPHVDIGRRSAINVYIKCSQEITEFFEADEETKTLASQGTFVAKQGDTWLLNVSKPHAVRMSSASLRSCISFSFRKLRFDELVGLLPAC